MKNVVLVLWNPKYAHNVGAVVRLASAYGVPFVLYTGDRVAADLLSSDRLPREERMKGYKDVEFRHMPANMSVLTEAGLTPVALEVRENSEPLHTFVHPPGRVAYIFGPEDGSLPFQVMAHSHRFVVVPTRHCLNLATAVATVLWDRYLKASPASVASTDVPWLFETPGSFEKRGPI